MAFTVENARLYAARSHAPESARHQLKAACADLPQDVVAELKIVEEQIARARKMLNDDTPACPACERSAIQPHHAASLMKALDGFLDRRRELLGRPRLATLRPSTKPARRSELPEPSPSQE